MSEMIYEVIMDADGVDCYINRGEIVRCEDCGHWKSDGHVQWCDAWNCGTSALGYCHRSKRREDGEA